MTRKRKRALRHVLETRGAFRLKERHVWPDQFRHGFRSVRVEWERLQAMAAELPITDLPEALQHWLWMLHRTRHVDVHFALRHGDFPFFDAWAHRFHMLDETLAEMGYSLPARVPFIYGGYVLAGLAEAAQNVFWDAGGSPRFASPYARPAGLSASAPEPRAPGSDADAPRPARSAGRRPT